MLAAIIPADTGQPVRFEDIRAENIADLAGGDIQLIGIRQLEMNMYLNENGKIEGLPLNFRATMLCHATGSIFADDVITGDTVILGPIDDEEGEDTALSAKQVEFLENFARTTARAGNCG